MARAAQTFQECRLVVPLADHLGQRHLIAERKTAVPGAEPEFPAHFIATGTTVKTGLARIKHQEWGPAGGRIRWQYRLKPPRAPEGSGIPHPRLGNHFRGCCRIRVPDDRSLGRCLTGGKKRQTNDGKTFHGERFNNYGRRKSMPQRLRKKFPVMRMRKTRFFSEI